MSPYVTLCHLFFAKKCFLGGFGSFDGHASIIISRLSIVIISHLIIVIISCLGIVIISH